MCLWGCPAEAGYLLAKSGLDMIDQLRDNRRARALSATAESPRVSDKVE
jgi:hypothetical protein